MKISISCPKLSKVLFACAVTFLLLIVPHQSLAEVKEITNILGPGGSGISQQTVQSSDRPLTVMNGKRVQGNDPATADKVIDQGMARRQLPMGVFVELSEPSLSISASTPTQGGASSSRTIAATALQAEKIEQEQTEFLRQAEILTGQRLTLPNSQSFMMNVPARGGQSISYKRAVNALYLPISMEEAQKLRSIPNVKRIEASKPYHLTLNKSVPQIHAPAAWSQVNSNGLPLTGAGIRVGVIDTGVDYKLNDLGGCFGPGCKVEDGYDFVDADSDPMDTHGHGTHVASTIAGHGLISNGTATSQLLGVAPDANIVAYRVCDDYGCADNAILAAIEQCEDPNGDGDFSDHLDVCSMSLGGSGNPDDILSTAVDHASNVGVIFTIAAGNSGSRDQTIESPGTSRSAITVAASCKTGEIGTGGYCEEPIASFSSRGPVVWKDKSNQEQTILKPDVAAPGVNICAARFPGVQFGDTCADGKHLKISGTSMATPHVAGVAALLKQANRSLTPKIIKGLMMSSARDLGLDQTVQGAGEVDVSNAMKQMGVTFSPISVNGTPLYWKDSSQSRIGAVTRTLTVKNTGTTAISFSVDTTNPAAGIMITPSTQSLTIPAKRSVQLKLLFTMDHDLVESSIYRDTLVLKPLFGSTPSILLPIEVLFGADVKTATEDIDLGITNGIPATPTFSKKIKITNKLSDQARAYDVNVQFLDHSGKPQEGISYEGPDTISFVPAGAEYLPMVLNINNASLPMGRYDGVVTLSRDGLVRYVINIHFFHGYQINVTISDATANGLPDELVLFKDVERWYSIDYPSKPLIRFFVTSPGEWNLITYRQNPATNRLSNFFKEHIVANTPIRPVVIQENQANYKITLNAVAPDSTPLKVGMPWVCHAFVHEPTGFMANFCGYYRQSGDYVNTTPLSSAFSISSAATALERSKNELYLYQFPRFVGLQNDISLTNIASDFTVKSIVVPQNDPSYTQGLIFPAICSSEYQRTPPLYPTSPWDTGAARSSCFGESFYAPTIPPSGKVTAYVADLLHPDPMHDEYPTTHSFQFYADRTVNGDIFDDTHPHYFVSTPEYLFSGERNFMWASPFGGIPWWIPFKDTYKTFKLDSISPNVISIGAGNLPPAVRWFNKNGDQVFLDQLFPYGFGYPHRFTDGSEESEMPTDLRGEFTFSGDKINTIHDYLYNARGDYASIGNPLPDGRYTFSMHKPVWLGGKLTAVDTEHQFTIGKDLDENPPILTFFGVTANGMWQNVFQNSIGNTVSFELEAQPKLLNGATEPGEFIFNLGHDALEDVHCQISVDNTQWTDLNVSQITALRPRGVRYKGSIPAAMLPKSEYYWIRINARDTAGNSLSTTMQVPYGTAM